MKKVFMSAVLFSVLSTAAQADSGYVDRMNEARSFPNATQEEATSLQQDVSGSFQDKREKMMSHMQKMMRVMSGMNKSELEAMQEDCTNKMKSKGPVKQG